MQALALGPFVCPLDGAALEATAGGARCTAGHSFDRAREGYLNLLPVQHKASRDPGDDQAMVVARRRTLDDGLFRPLADTVFESVADHARRCGSERPVRIVDAGCGEGYYLAHLRRRALASDQAGVLALAGYDISKWAVRVAARRSRDIAWAVASNRQPPVAPASIDLILSLFGFPHWASFEAILAPGGRMLTVDADANHLLELRSVIYPTLEPSDAVQPAEALARGWQVSAERRLEYRVELASAAQIQALIAMTPHAHRMSASGREALAALSHLTVTLSMVMRELQPPRHSQAAMLQGPTPA